MKKYFSNFREQHIHKSGDFNNSMKFVYNTRQKKNQTKNFVMLGKSQKSNSNISSVNNHVSSFKNIQK